MVEETYDRIERLQRRVDRALLMVRVSYWLLLASLAVAAVGMLGAILR